MEERGAEYSQTQPRLEQRDGGGGGKVSSEKKRNVFEEIEQGMSGGD